ncbi:hypothetical protein [Mangrovactinospora gilvigrisea]|nr:hypothetical protein [Mangrovactinospora gilvigrisea]
MRGRSLVARTVVRDTGGSDTKQWFGKDIVVMGGDHWAAGLTDT